VKASSAEAIAGTDDEKFLTPLTGVTSVKTHSPFLKRAYFEDQRSTGTSGGSASSSNWTTRTINTTVFNNITGVSLSSNVVTLPAGTYMIEAFCPAFRTRQHKARLHNDTDNTLIAYGSSEHAPDNTGGNPPSGGTSSRVFVPELVLATSKGIRLDHRVDTNPGGDALGRPLNISGITEVYTQLTVWKLD
jgi:hypothetical protein